MREKAALVYFLIQCFASLDVDAVASDVGDGAVAFAACVETGAAAKVGALWKKMIPLDGE